MHSILNIKINSSTDWQVQQRSGKRELRWKGAGVQCSAVPVQYYAFLGMFQSGELSWQALQSGCLYHYRLHATLYFQSNIRFNNYSLCLYNPGPTAIKTNRHIWTWCLMSPVSTVWGSGMYEYSLQTIIDDPLTCKTNLSVTKLQHWLPPCSRNELELRSSEF